MHGVPFDVWSAGITRVVAVSFGLAMAVTLIIRLAWRPFRSHLSYRSGHRAAHAQPPLKSGTHRAAG